MTALFCAARRLCTATFVGALVLAWCSGVVCAASASSVSAAAPAAEKAESGEAGNPHGHAGHDPFDLTHANASPQQGDPSEWRYDMSLCTMVVFIVLLALLSKFAWGPVMAGLENREKYIASKIAEAKQNAEQSAAELNAYRAKLAAAAQESMALVAQARKDAEAVAEKVRHDAQQYAARERERAIADILAAKNVALREVARRGADLAVSLAGRIVRRELKTADHAALITEALAQLPSKN